MPVTEERRKVWNVSIRRTTKLVVGGIAALTLAYGATTATAAETNDTTGNFLKVADDSLTQVLDLNAASVVAGVEVTRRSEGLPATGGIVSIPAVDGSFEAFVYSSSDVDHNVTSLPVPEGVEVSVDETGAFATYSDESGSTVGTVAALWAKDASGQDIATQLSWDGSSLRQTVDASATNVDYPIVTAAAQADGWYSSAWITYQGSLYVVHAVPTAAGRIFNGVALLPSHTNELKTRLGSNANKVTGTIENQFHCHVVFNAAMSSGNTAYDMESWRPNVSYLVAWQSGCNP